MLLLSLCSLSKTFPGLLSSPSLESITSPSPCPSSKRIWPPSPEHSSYLTEIFENYPAIPPPPFHSSATFDLIVFSSAFQLFRLGNKALIRLLVNFLSCNYRSHFSDNWPQQLYVYLLITQEALQPCLSATTDNGTHIAEVLLSSSFFHYIKAISPFPIMNTCMHLTQLCAGEIVWLPPNAARSEFLACSAGRLYVMIYCSSKWPKHSKAQ